MNRAQRRRLARQLTKLPDDQRNALHAEVVNGIPTHLHDQMDAATADANRRLRYAATVKRYDAAEVRPSTRLRERLDQYLIDEMAGAVKHCPHLTSPQPCAATLWEDPFTVRCLDCAATPEVTLDEVEDNTCDLCRTHDPEGVYGQIVQVGALLMSFGACEACRTELRGATA